MKKSAHVIAGLVIAILTLSIAYPYHSSANQLSSWRVGLNETWIQEYIQQQGLDCPFCPINAQPRSLASIQCRIYDLAANQHVGAYREIVPLQVLQPNPAFGDATNEINRQKILDVIRLYQNYNLYLILSLGCPFPGWAAGQEGTTWCPWPADDASFDAVRINVSWALGNFVNWLREQGVSTTWMADRLYIEGFNEFDSTNLCTSPDAVSPEHAAILQGGINWVLNYYGLSVRQTSPSVNGSYSGLTGTYGQKVGAYLNRYYTAGGGGYPQVHYYTQNIDDLREFLLTVNNAMAPFGWQNRLILGETGWYDYVYPDCQNGINRDGFYRDIYNDATMQSMLDILIFWRTMDISAAVQIDNAPWEHYFGVVHDNNSGYKVVGQNLFTALGGMGGTGPNCWTPNTVNIRVAAGSGGTITPFSKAVTVNYGASQTFSITPINTCYKVIDVVIDGTTHVGAVNNYTFENVTANHSISASFATISCDDYNACTQDVCDPATGCHNYPIVCNDNNLCTTDNCNPATGCVYTPSVCSDGNACTTDSCNPATGACVFTSITCNDGNACTTDSCNPSTGCVYTTITCNDGNKCTNDSCNPATGCVYTTITCNDGNKCTNDSCNPATGCVYTPITCNDGDKCTTDACNTATGVCVYTPITCNDGNACTADTCNAATGTCVYTPITCNDGNACTTDSCNTATGCVYTPISCNDNNIFTNDTCNTMTGCVHTPTIGNNSNFTMIDQANNAFAGANDVVFTSDGTLKTSVVASGQVSNATLSSACPFYGMPWTAHDVAVYGSGTYTVFTGCSAGSPGCGSGAPIAFTVKTGEIGIHALIDWNGNQNMDVVNVLKPHAISPNIWTGGCGSNAATTVWAWMSYDFDGDGVNGTPIRDGLFAGENITFNLGADPCNDSATRCNDNNACTTDTCDTTTGVCVHTLIVCNDNNACTTDTCNTATGVCTYTPIVCNDNNACTYDFCNTATGACVYAAVNCNDGNACTTDTCNTATGCISTPIVCNDNNACTTDTCDTTTGVCVHTLIVCNDNNACTTDTCNTATGVCTYTPIVCNDNNKCTTDTCNTATGACVFTPIICDDNNACTTDACIVATGCFHTPKVCDDSNECTTDTCNPATGACVFTPVINGTACTSGACQNGTCSVASPCPAGSYHAATLKGAGSSKSWIEKQIMTSFTAMQGCILRYTDSVITVSRGAVLQVNWRGGNGPQPTSVVWQPVGGILQTLRANAIWSLTTQTTTGTMGTLTLNNTSAHGMDSDALTVQVESQDGLYHLAIVTAGTGIGTVTSSPAGINCGLDCTEQYPSGQVVTLTAVPGANQVFAGWSGGGCSGTGDCTVAMTADTTVSTTFNNSLNGVYQLTIYKSDVQGTGTVTSSPAGIKCGSDCSEQYASGTVVSLTAVPDAGSKFMGWSVLEGPLSSCDGMGTCTVIMDKDITVKTGFSLL